MSVWKDKAHKHWCYSFQYQGKMYAGRGYGTRREAVAAREKKREEVLRGTALTLSGQTPPVMGFGDLSSKYLDLSERKHAPKTYQYTTLTYRRFLDYYEDRPSD